MSVLIALQQFLGANTQRNLKLPLGPGVGVNARNLDTSHGDFRGLKAATQVHSFAIGAQQISLYRFGRDTASDTQYWLTSSLDVNWVRSLIAEDTTERTYWTDGVKPRYTDTTLLGSPPYPTSSVTLGVPAPDTQMSATETLAGTGPEETRIYTDTFMRANGDESAPNALTRTITVKAGATVQLGGFDAVPSGSHGITKRRIYVSTGGDFFRIAEITTGTATFNDTAATVRGLILQTGGSTSKPAWLEPPDNLVGLIELWGGMIGGFVGKSARVCVPDFPHAWPIEYENVLPDTIVGTARFARNWVLCTTGQPYVITGSTPANLNPQPTDFMQGCVSKRSVVSVKHGVCYASREGLCYYGTNGPPRVLTAGFIDVVDWQALDPDTIIGANWREWYIGFYFNGTDRKGFMVNTLDPNYVIWLDQGARGAWVDPISGKLYMLGTLSGGSQPIQLWYSGSLTTATFMNGKVRSQHESCPGVAMLVGTTYTSASLKLYADGVLKHTAAPTNQESFRLPSGYMARDFQLEISGTGPLEGAVLAEETSDLP